MARTTFYAASYVVLHRKEDDHVLLLRRRNTGFADGHWSLPSGHIDEGEGPLLCAQRECAEEVGVQVELDALKLFHVSHTPYSTAGEAFGFFYVATTWQGEPQNLETDRCDAVAWYPLSALPTPVTGFVKQALASLHRGTVATFSHVVPPDNGWAQ